MPLAHKFKLQLDPELPISREENYVAMVRSFCALNGCKISGTSEAWIQRGYLVFELEISYGHYKSKFLIERSSIYIIGYMYRNKWEIFRDTVYVMDGIPRSKTGEKGVRKLIEPEESLPYCDFKKTFGFINYLVKNWETISKVLWVYGDTGDKYFDKVSTSRLMEDCQVFDIVTLKACMSLLSSVDMEYMEKPVLVDLEREPKTTEHFTTVHEM
ncbi:hypothetical protein DM860_015939 [Cuscuta australis]|uniref:Uncharacterized protein n=1 Tax=Cuscuta australis TaxID=267555 RepID=A0A328DYL8_9ASTE|nr:hypothetical protein DM860_015939 [Cuscuta australis]